MGGDYARLLAEPKPMIVAPPLATRRLTMTLGFGLIGLIVILIGYLIYA